MVNMSAKFDEYAQKGLVSIVFTRFKHDARMEQQQRYYIPSAMHYTEIKRQLTFALSVYLHQVTDGHFQDICLLQPGKLLLVFAFRPEDDVFQLDQTFVDSVPTTLLSQGLTGLQ